MNARVISASIVEASVAYVVYNMGIAGSNYIEEVLTPASVGRFAVFVVRVKYFTRLHHEMGSSLATFTCRFLSRH